MCGLSLYKHITSEYINITRFEVGEFLKSQNNYQLTYNPFKVVNKPIVERFPNARHQIDLIDMNAVIQANSGYRYIYVQVDVFSRKCWLRKLKKKTASEVSLALLSCLEEMNTTPIMIQTDNGSEFKRQFNKVCEENGIKHIFSISHTPNQNAIVERKNKDVRKILRKFFLDNNTLKWHNILEEVQSNLNATYIQTIKATPSIRPDIINYGVRIMNPLL